MDPSPATRSLLSGFSLEVSGRDVDDVPAAAASVPPGTRVNVTYLAGEDLAQRRAVARAVRDAGLVPVPHLAARRLRSRAQLVELLEALRDDGTGAEVFVVGGDPSAPEGPFDSALDLLRSGALAEHGVRRVGLAGYPEGHPGISPAQLEGALLAKVAAAGETGLEPFVVTQFGFDVDPVLSWLERLRADGVDVPVGLGVPGPAGVRRLLAYARRFGVASSASIARKHGTSLTGLLGTAGPGDFVEELAARLDPARHGRVWLHFYTFGGLPATTAWIRQQVG